eukprot:CAMPEP_0113968680 /NCGR_PEP_ID=MMETSP0011_2-20120614/9698_1 /TAXON_ID=101924 /ORGANISM="Rhodosorus marinus" /LENGTH=692 /DNA_ID=CAMNT_0000981857 /DNA_START=49 /DNA_END=2132 /DNA_ORIENTATION=- /assembly_acc=CAM_ASM_000156
MVVGVNEIGMPATDRGSDPAGKRKGIGNDSMRQKHIAPVPQLLQGLSPDSSYGSIEAQKDVDFQKENNGGRLTEMESVVTSIAQTRALINSSQVFNRETKEEIKSWQARNMEITARNRSMLQEIHARESQKAQREKRLEDKQQHLAALRNEIQDRTMSAKQFNLSLGRAKQACEEGGCFSPKTSSSNSQSMHRMVYGIEVVSFDAVDSQVLLIEKELTDAAESVQNLEEKCHFILERKRLVRARTEQGTRRYLVLPRFLAQYNGYTVKSEKAEVEGIRIKVEESLKAVGDCIKQLEHELEKLNCDRRNELAELEDLHAKQEQLAEEKDGYMKGVHERVLIARTLPIFLLSEDWIIGLTSDDSMTTQIEDLRKEISAMDKQAQEVSCFLPPNWFNRFLKEPITVQGRDKLSLYRVKLQQKEVGPGIASGKDFNPTFTSEVFYLPKQRDSMQLERLLDEKTNTSKEVEDAVENLRITKDTLTKQENNVRKEIEMTNTFRHCAIRNFDRLQETLKQQEAELRARQESLTSRDPGIESELRLSAEKTKLLNDAKATIGANSKRMRAMEDENKSLDAQLEKLREDSAHCQALRTDLEGTCSNLDAIKRKHEAEKTKQKLMETELRELENSGAMHFAAAEKKLRLAQEELQRERAVRENIKSEILQAKAKVEQIRTMDRLTPPRTSGVDITSPVGGKV